LAKEMSQLNNVVRLITSDANHFSSMPKTNKIYNHEHQQGVSITWIKTYKYLKTASFKRVLSWLDFEWKLFRMPIDKNAKPDVVIVSSLSIFSIIYGFFLKKRFNSFLVFEIRDIWPLTLVEEGGFSSWNPLTILIGLIEKFGYSNSDLIVGTMPNLKQHIINRGILNKSIFCSPLGFDPSNFEELNFFMNNPFEKLKSEGKLIIGYCGSMGISNGLDLFIQTIKDMDNCPEIQFLLVGSGDMRDNYIKELESNSNVVFLPRIPYSDVKYFLDICDILFLSTMESKVWLYGQSMNKVVDYMLAAKPIVAIYSGFPSMINEANCGVYLDTQSSQELKNQFLNFANLSKQERRLIGLNGRTWIFENRSYKKLAKEYYDIIKEMLECKFRKRRD